MNGFWLHETEGFTGEKLEKFHDMFRIEARN
jgi:hypothetical protein